MLKFYGGLLSQGDLVYDAGANHGRYSKIYLELGTKVLAIEPHPSCIISLEKIQTPDFTLVRSAVSDKEGVISMMLCNQDEVSTLSTEFKDEYAKQDFLNWDSKIEVKTTTFDTLIESYGLPKYLKIDIEGFEHVALRALHSPVPIISFEFTHPFRHYAEECIALIDKLGKYKYNYYSFENFDFLLDQAVSSDDIIEVLGNLDDAILVGDIYCFQQK